MFSVVPRKCGHIARSILLYTWKELYNISQISIFMYFTKVFQQAWHCLYRSELSTCCSHCSNQHHIQLCADISWKQSRQLILTILVIICLETNKYYKKKHILIINNINNLQMWRMGIVEEAHSILNFCYKTAKPPVTPNPPPQTKNRI